MADECGHASVHAGGSGGVRSTRRIDCGRNWPCIANGDQAAKEAIERAWTHRATAPF